MSEPRWISYDFAILRVVPHVHLGEYANVGVVVHARTAGFLGIRTRSDPDRLRAIAGGVDLDLLVRYLDCFEKICAGDASAGPIALLPPSERFHWLTAPRSDVLQPSAVHEGICEDPGAALDDLFAKLVT